MKVADTRLMMVQALLYGSLSEVAVTVSARTLRRRISALPGCRGSVWMWIPWSPSADEQAGQSNSEVCFAARELAGQSVPIRYDPQVNASGQA